MVRSNLYKMKVPRGRWATAASRLATACKTALARINSIHKQIPYLRNVKWNFISLHYIYIISWAMVGSVVVYGAGQIPYTDALFLASGAVTQSGLNTIDLNLLHTYAQLFLYILSMFTNPIVINSFVVFVRLYWFEKRFEHIVRDARALRRTKSRASTVARDQPDAGQEESGIRGHSIVVLRNESGEARDAGQDVAKLDPESNSESGSLSPKEESRRGSESKGVEEPGRESPLSGESNQRLPTRLSPEHHIAFLQHQRADKGTLRIPSPREYDRGGVPQVLEEDEDVTNGEPCPPNEPSDDAVNENDNGGGHITINEPQIFRSRTRTGTFPRVESRRTYEREDDRPGLIRHRSRRSTLNGLVRTLTQEPERDTLPYLSWNATIGRNSAFVALTEEQREELGGIEYRALKTLALVLVAYFVLFHVFGIICLVPWIMNTHYGSVVTADGQGRPWWGIFTSQSGLNNVGFTLTPDSMNSFQDAVFPLLVLCFLIVIGNTGFPCMLRLVIWALSKILTTGSPLWEELKFLLDHPRRCFTLLFPRNATWWLFAILIALNGVDLVFFIILDVRAPSNISADLTADNLLPVKRSHCYCPPSGHTGLGWTIPSHFHENVRLWSGQPLQPPPGHTSLVLDHDVYFGLPHCYLHATDQRL
jgi:hypothetical protein